MRKITKNSIPFILITLVPVCVTGWFFLQFIAWDGHNTLSTDFSSTPKAISQWYPSGNVSNRLRNMHTGDIYQSISADEAFIDLTTPRAFDRVAMTIEYTNSNQPLIEAGMISNDISGEKTLFPFENQIIDTALVEWKNVLTQDDITLVQSPDAPQQYTSVADFLADIPQQARVGVYRYDPQISYRDPTYKKQSGVFFVPYIFRGSHEFVSYIKNENLSATFDIVDTNVTEGDDRVQIDVYNSANELVQTQLLEDDGDMSASGNATEKRTISITQENLPEGAYRFVVATTGDVGFVVQTDQHQFVVKNTVYGFDPQKIPTLSVDAKKTLFSDGDIFEFIALERDELQLVRINKIFSLFINGVKLPERWINTADEADALHRMAIENNGLQITTKGYFAFTAESFFDPDYEVEKITAESQRGAYDYILYAGYTPPINERNKKVQTIEIDITSFLIDRKNMTFTLAAPTMKEAGHAIQIHRVHFDLYREPLFKRILQRIQGKL